MKRCPTCNITFPEEELTYCTNDGTRLVPDGSAVDPESQRTVLFAEPQPTMVMPPPLATEYAPPAAPAPSSPQPYGWSNESPQAWAPPPPPPQFPLASQPQQGLAVASLVLGAVSLTIGWCCNFGVLTGPAAIVLGIISLVQIKNNPGRYSGKPLAIIGIATGLLYLVIWVLIVVLYGIAVFLGGLR